MREGIHPKFHTDTQVTCSCGNTWVTGSTRAVIRTDMCYKCHPFYTGEQRMVDTEGQVDRFYKKLEARDTHKAAVVARQVSKASPEMMLITSLNLGARVEKALTDANINTAAEAVARMADGDEAMLTIDSLGRKGLIDLKKALRVRGLLTTEEAPEAPATEAA